MENFSARPGRPGRFLSINELPAESFIDIDGTFVLPDTDLIPTDEIDALSAPYTDTAAAEIEIRYGQVFKSPLHLLAQNLDELFGEPDQPWSL